MYIELKRRTHMVQCFNSLSSEIIFVTYCQEVKNIMKLQECGTVAIVRFLIMFLVI